MRSVEKVFQACQKEREKKAKQVQKVKATIKNNQVYNAMEILKAAVTLEKILFDIQISFWKEI